MRVVIAAAYVRIVSASKQKTWSIVFSVTQRSWNPSASARCATRRIVSTSIGSGERWGSETPRAIFTRLSSWLLVLDHLTVRRLHRAAGAVREDLLDLGAVPGPQQSRISIRQHTPTTHNNIADHVPRGFREPHADNDAVVLAGRRFVVDVGDP